jgi:hypothetical protein
LFRTIFFAGVMLAASVPASYAPALAETPGPLSYLPTPPPWPTPHLDPKWLCKHENERTVCRGPAKGLLERWYVIEAVCRGDPTGSQTKNTEAYKTCKQWPIVGKQLEAFGYCFTGTFGATMHWEYTRTTARCKQVQDRDALKFQRQINPE